MVWGISFFVTITLIGIGGMWYQLALPHESRFTMEKPRGYRFVLLFLGMLVVGAVALLDWLFGHGDLIRIALNIRRL